MLIVATGAFALFATSSLHANSLKFDDSIDSFRSSSISECKKETTSFFQSECVKKAGEMYLLYENIKNSKSGETVISSCLPSATRTQNQFYSLLVCVSSRNKIIEGNPFPGLSLIINERPKMLDHWSLVCQKKNSRSCMDVLSSDFSTFLSNYKSLNGHSKKSKKAKAFLACLPLKEDPIKWNFGIINICVRKGFK